MLRFLEGIDPAPNAKKAKLVVDAIGRLSQVLWKNKALVISEKRLEQIKAWHEGFLRRYLKKHNLPPALGDYIFSNPKLTARIARDIYAMAVNINGRKYLLLLFKDAERPLGKKGNFSERGTISWRKDIRDFKLIQVKSESEVKVYQKSAGAFMYRILPGEENKQEREKLKKSIANLFGHFKSVFEDEKSIQEIEKSFGKSDHPDLLFSNMLIGSPGAKVPLLGATVLGQIEAKSGEEKTQTIAELLYETSLQPIETLIKRDAEGRPMVLTQKEMLIAYKKGALKALKTYEYGDSSRLRRWIMLIYRAIREGNMDFEHTEESRFWPDEISFSKIKEDARRIILTAATIPRDEKTWVFLSNDAHLYQAAYTLTRMLGIEQEMAIIDLEEKGYHREKRDFLSAVIMEAYEETRDIKGEIRDEERRLDFHNRFLQRLHYSYKVDTGFKEEIDSLREKILSQVNPAKGEAFRFIADSQTEAFALEFAMRTGETPFIADPYVIGDYANSSNEKEFYLREEPYYFMNYSELYGKYRGEFLTQHLFLFDSIIEHAGHAGKLKLRGGMNYLRHTLRTIFTYNEMVDFLKNEEDKKLVNPAVAPYKTTQFSLPDVDFTRPDDSTAFSNMLPSQLFQAVEGFSLEEWDKNENDILKRYSYLAAKGDIDPHSFMRHVSRLAENDFNIIWDKNNMQWAGGHEYYIKRAKRTRAIIETVLRLSGPDFLNDDFLVKYYSHADEIKDDGTLIYFEIETKGGLLFSASKKTDKKISPSDAINSLHEVYAWQGFMGRYPLYVLSIIMDIYPKRIGPKTMNFLVNVIEAAMDRYSIYREDDWGWREGSYGVAPVFDIPLAAFDKHPEYYAKMLLESSLTPESLTFLIRPETAPGGGMFLFGAGSSREIEYENFISQDMLQEIIKQNSLKDKQLKLLKAIINDAPGIAGDTILKEWRKFDNDALNSLLGMGITAEKLDSSRFEQMEAIFKQQNFKNRSVALFLAIYPDFKIDAAKALDQIFKDDSTQVIFKLLKAIHTKLWTENEVRGLYRTGLWSRASVNVRHNNLNQILSLSKENRDKFFTAFSGKKLKPQRIFDIYPLNIPESHALYEKYKYELEHYDMSFSSFTGDFDASKSEESESDVSRRVTHRARLLFNDLGAILKFSHKELSRRVSLLEDFETKNVELDNTAYRLLMIVPEEHFDELYGILEENFNSLKNLKQAKKEITAQFKQIIELNPELKEFSQKSIVNWAAGELGITSRRRITESSAKQNITKAFHNKLLKDNLGVSVATGKSDGGENKKFMSLIAANKLLLAIAENLKLYKSWLVEIPEAETDPGRMLPPVIIRNDL